MVQALCQVQRLRTAVYFVRVAGDDDFERRRDRNGKHYGKGKDKDKHHGKHKD